MNLYIQVENNQPINHPAFEDNLIQVFGSIPSNWEPFIRVEQPVLEEYEVLVSNEPKYEKIDNIWMDVWYVRDMTSEEKLIKMDDSNHNMINKIIKQ
jgi:hypothetical protein